MRGDLYNGWLQLSGDFAPSLNTDSDPTTLKPFESPACYGVDCQADGFLKAGSVLTGTARSAPAKTISAVTYTWYYDRVWRASSADLIYGARHYDAVYVPQGFGKVTASDSVVTFMPALGSDMWIVTSTGSHILRNTNASGQTSLGQFALDQFVQEVYVSTASHATTVATIPHFSNVDGVFSWDGRKITELTRPVRDSLGSFVGAALTVDYSERFLIGGTSYVIDLETGKLFDYGTSGFLFTSRTLASSDFTPFQVDAVSVDLEYISTGDDVLRWETKLDDGNWYEEDYITLQDEEGRRSHIELPVNNGSRSGRKFALRITALPSFVKIRSINAMVREFAQESPSE